VTLAARRRRDAAEFRMRPDSADAGEPLTIIDATVIDEPTNADEALALFSLYAEPGDTITICSDWCLRNLSASNECSCKPIAIVVGAKA
jgi:hypothetical protein